MQAGELFVKINADTKGFDKAMTSVTKSAEKVGKKMQAVGGKMTKYVTLPIVGIGTAFGKAAMDLEATGAKYETVFDGMTEEADAFLDKFKELTPATTAEARDMASGIQDMLIPMGFAREAATDMTGELMHVIGALTNFNSSQFTAEDVTGKVNAALRGQYEGLSSLGVQLDATTVKEKAIEMGLAATTDEVTKQMQAQVVMSEIYAQSGDALTAYTEANLDTKTQLGLLRAEAINIAADFGEMLLPAIEGLIEKARGAVEWFGQLTERQKETIIMVAGVVAAVGPLLLGFGKILTLLPLLGTAFTVLTGPVGIVIAVVAGLVAGFIHLMSTNDDFKKKVEEVIPATKEIFETAFAKIKEALELVWAFIKEYVTPILVGLFVWVKDRIPAMQVVFEATFKLIKAAIETVWTFIDNIFLPILKQLYDWIAPYLPVIGQIFGDVFDGIAKDIGAIVGVIETVLEWFTKLFEAIGQFESTSVNLGGTIGNNSVGDISQYTGGTTHFGDGSSFTPHALGLNNVPYDGYKAILHKGERVMTAAQNRTGGGDSTVIVQNMHVRNDNDIRLVARELYALERRAIRGGGMA